MIERLTVKRGSYRDSVTLMLASNDAARLEGVAEASAVCATPLNVELLAAAGFELAEQGSLDPSDLVVAVRAESEEAMGDALAAIESRLAGGDEEGGAPEQPKPRSLVGATRLREDANLAVISVPGESAAYECGAALEAGLNVFCFSSGFGKPIERALKQRALERGLLMMGPDCGTAVIDGVGIGFANELERGPVGIVGASGTGMQQVGCLLDSAGVGISQAIGLGGRDLSAEVGGAMALEAVRRLGEDSGTEVIVVVAKDSAPEVAEAVAELALETGKPVVLGFPGLPGFEPPGAARCAGTLEAVACMAAESAGASLELELPALPEVRPGLIRGLFSGGTLRDEALALIGNELAALEERPPLALGEEPDAEQADRHLLIDYGSESLTVGRAHPMIDPSLRNGAVRRAAAEGPVSVLLVDVVLGRGSHPDPAGELAPAIESAREERGDDLAVVVSLCGARRDPQGIDLQAERLRTAGATVCPSNAAAARLAVAAATGNAASGVVR